MEERQQRLHGRLQINTEFGTYLSDSRIRLLEAIDTLGSISKAARSVPLSYKGAWEAIDEMNNLADHPLVVRSTGGLNGGGTALTDYGRQVIALYRTLESEYQAMLDRVTKAMGDNRIDDVRQFHQLLKRLSMKTSARNQFAGPITALRKGDVDVEVSLQLDGDNELHAVVTRESAESLGLQIGMEINALVKSSSILLLTDPGMRTSARNQLWGKVSHISKGAVSTEVTVTIPSGKSLCAVVTPSSQENMGLEISTPVCAVFKASSVILCLNS